MANHHTHPAPQGHGALFTTPTALMLDTRLTPLERNGWQVLRMLRTADGHSLLASMGQLRRYLTTSPLGQRAGYGTAWRALIVLRLTGWISLVGQHRDPMTGHVLSERYQVHDSALSFPQACALDQSLMPLLQASIGHDNNQVDRIALHIQEALERPPVAASADTQTPARDDDEAPPPSTQGPAEASAPGDFRHDATGLQQTAAVRRTTTTQASTYRTYMYKVRTYRTRAREGDGSVSPPMTLPPCLGNAKADQRKDVLAALRRLPSGHRQDVLDELQARSQSGTVRNAVAYFFGLIRRVLAGEFRLWAGRKTEPPARYPPQPTVNPATAGQHTEPRPEPALRPASREIDRAHLANMRKTLGLPARTNDAIAQGMPTQRWHPA